MIFGVLTHTKGFVFGVSSHESIITCANINYGVISHANINDGVSYDMYKHIILLISKWRYNAFEHNTINMQMNVDSLEK